jgi:hypothetical protein
LEYWTGPNHLTELLIFDNALTPLTVELTADKISIHLPKESLHEVANSLIVVAALCFPIPIGWASRFDRAEIQPAISHVSLQLQLHG